MKTTTLREQLEYYGPYGLLLQLRRDTPRDYEDFIDVLYTDLDVVIGLMEADAKDMIGTGEDVLNRELVRLLKARTYAASHDNDEGGHVDIHVQSGDNQYSWLGEAKLDKGPAYLLSGLNQLSSRYARGTPGNNCGGLIIYVQKDRISERFHEWRMTLESSGPEQFEKFAASDCQRRPGLAFYSAFVLPRIGEFAPKYCVRHLAVSLFREASTKGSEDPATVAETTAEN